MFQVLLKGNRQYGIDLVWRFFMTCSCLIQHADIWSNAIWSQLCKFKTQVLVYVTSKVRPKLQDWLGPTETSMSIATISSSRLLSSFAIGPVPSLWLWQKEKTDKFDQFNKSNIEWKTSQFGLWQWICRISLIWFTKPIWNFTFDLVHWNDDQHKEPMIDTKNILMGN